MASEGILSITTTAAFFTPISSSISHPSRRIVLSTSCQTTLASANFLKDASIRKALGEFQGSKGRRKFKQLQVRSAAGPNDGIKWWEKDGGPNMLDVHSAKDLTDALAAAGEKLVVVEFFATWCGSCRALYPKLCRLASELGDVIFIKVNFDENKPLCKKLDIKVLPYFHLYRGANGRLDAFSCSLSKLQRLKDAIATHNTERCSLGPPVGIEIIGSTESLESNTLDEPATASSAR